MKKIEAWALQRKMDEIKYMMKNRFLSLLINVQEWSLFSFVYSDYMKCFNMLLDFSSVPTKADKTSKAPTEWVNNFFELLSKPLANATVNNEIDTGIDNQQKMTQT